MMTASKGRIIFGIAAILLATYVVAGPYITVHQIRSAAISRDAEELSQHIEFPSLRQSFKDQINAMFAKELNENSEMKNNPFAAMGMAFAGVMVEKTVDVFITPAGIIQLMEGENPQQGLSKKGTNAGAKDAAEPVETNMSYESLNKFVVRIKRADGKEQRFTFRRRGLSWKLTDITIPFS